VLIPKKDLPTTKSIGMALPIIAALGDGWFLAAHPNGAVIVRESLMSVLWSCSGGVDEDITPIPESVRSEAVKAFERIAWPLVCSCFYEEAEK
jgi:hypothetical protein